MQVAHASYDSAGFGTYDQPNVLLNMYSNLVEHCAQLIPIPMNVILIFPPIIIILTAQTSYLKAFHNVLYICKWYNEIVNIH